VIHDTGMITSIILTRAAFLGSVSLLSAGTNSNHAVLSSPQDDTLLSTPALSTRLAVNNLLQNDPSLAGPLIRLAFHDAATFQRDESGGPNGSIRFELEWNENRGLSKPLEIVENIHNSSAALSLSDTIALAGAQAVETAGGPHIPIRLGRVDATTADSLYLQTPFRGTMDDKSLVTRTLPSAGLDSVGLRRYFQRFHLSQAEFVALSGIHGLGRHVSLLGMSKECLRNLTKTCLEEAPVRLPFVTSSVNRFDNSYFQYLLKWYNREIELGEAAFLPTDVALVVDSGLRRHVQRFAENDDLYRRIFTRAYQTLVETTATTRERC